MKATIKDIAKKVSQSIDSVPGDQRDGKYFQ